MKTEKLNQIFKSIKTRVIIRPLITSILILFIIPAFNCKTVTNAPDGHDLSKGGVMHKSGLFDPDTNSLPVMEMI